jgi:HEAT repeat protein
LEVFQAVTAAVSDTSGDPGFRTQTLEGFHECKADPATVRGFLENVVKENKNNWIAETAKRQLDFLNWQTKRQIRAQPSFLHGQSPVTSDAGPNSDPASLLDRLKSNPDDYPTAQALSKLPSQIRRQAVEILLNALRQNKVRFPSNTISRLSLFGEDAVAAMPFLLQFADSDNSGLANNSMAALGEIGPSALEAKPIVEQALEDGDAFLRWRAANTLCSIDPDNFDSHLERLVDLLGKDTQRESSDFAIRALGRFGPRAARATPFLIEKLNDEKLRLAAADALSKIAEDPKTKSNIAAALAKDLKHNSIYSRDAAARLLGELGPHARVALPDLEEAAKSDDSEFAKIVRDSIAKIENKKE